MKKMTEKSYINGLAHMLDESFSDQGNFRYSYPDGDDREITVANLQDALENVFPHQERGIAVNVGPGGKIWGQVNSASKEPGRMVVTLAPYKNGHRSVDMSLTKDPPMTSIQLAEECRNWANSGDKVIVRSRPFGAMGPHMFDVVEYPVREIEISTTDGVYLRPAEEKTVKVNEVEDNPDWQKTDDMDMAGDDYEKTLADRQAYAKTGSVTEDELENMMEVALDERRMAGPAAARNGGIDEIADMRQKLATGVVEFDFVKHSENGDVPRHAIGTTSEKIIPVADRRRLDPNYDENVASYERRANFIIWFWDLEKNAVRCFNTNRFEGIVNYTQTDRRADNNEVQQFGDIYVHRDVDAGMEVQDTITPARAEEIFDEIGDDLRSPGGGDIGRAILAGGFDDIGDFPEIRVDPGDGGVPVLNIYIRKRGTDNDQPYPLRLNELRRVIREKYGVNVRKVVIDGEFEF